MTGLQLFIAIVGVGVTVLVGFAMILLTPRYTVEDAEETTPTRSSASPVPATDGARTNAA